MSRKIHKTFPYSFLQFLNLNRNTKDYNTQGIFSVLGIGVGDYKPIMADCETGPKILTRTHHRSKKKITYYSLHDNDYDDFFFTHTPPKETKDNRIINRVWGIEIRRDGPFAKMRMHLELKTKNQTVNYSEPFTQHFKR